MVGIILSIIYLTSCFILYSIKKPIENEIEFLAIILWPFIALSFLSNYVHKKYWGWKISKNPNRFQTTRKKR